MKPTEQKTIKMWVASDEDGAVWIYENKPTRGVNSWYGNIGNYDLIEQRFLPFPAPKWEDEPIQVELTVKKVNSDDSRD